MPANRLLTLAALLALALSLLVACGGGATTAPTTAPAAQATDAPAPTAAPAASEGPAMADDVALPDVDPTTVTGNIIVAGSSTVFPLAERMGELFIEDGYVDQISIDSIGSGAGFERFCTAGETDIANASRPINDEEKAACEAAGRPALEFRVGTDALAIVVSSENDFLSELSMEQLTSIFSGESRTWADVDASYPAETIQLFSPGTDSGTFDYFVEVVLDEDNARILGANPQLSEDDNVLVQGIEGSPYAIGFFGYAYYLENQGRLKILDIDGVTPTAATAEDGSYPLSRPLYIYSAASILGQKPQVAAFINFFLTNVNDEIAEVGYFPASDEALAAAKNTWLDTQ
jgi:phosphate transport system substrate-binding protein